MNNLNRVFGELRAIPGNARDTRTIQFVISTGRKDRHSTVLSIEGWDLAAYQRNPIVGYQHDVYGDTPSQSPNPDSVIGKSRVFIEGDRLVGEVTFEPAEINPLAEKVFQKVLFGTLRTASVGFLPLEAGHWGTGEEARNGKNPTYYYGKRELLEWSIVNIPSNSDAIIKQLERKQLELLKGSPANKDLALLQIKMALAGVPNERDNTEVLKMELAAACKGIPRKALRKTR